MDRDRAQGDPARPTGGYPAVPTGTGRYPAVPGGSPESARYPAVRPSTGGYTAVPGPGHFGGPPSTGRQSAVPPPSSLARVPAAPPPSSVGGMPAVPPPSSVGAVPAVPPPSGARDAATTVHQTVKPDAVEPNKFGRFPRIGETVDAYSIRELLGQGNMGKIYRVRDSMGRNLAMKVILQEIANTEGLARFEREGQALASIPRHRNVVAVHSTGRVRGMPYMIMDFVGGRSLESFLKDGPLPVKQAGVVGEKIGKALEVCHNAGVLHRDLKPANILIHSETGEPILTDFGLAGMTGAKSLTQTGDLLGTPLYMSPEQVLGLNKAVDGRADVWGLGVLIYEMLAGTVPFPGQTMVEVCEGITGRDPVPVNELCPDADPAITGIVAKALQKKKENRYATPGELARALRAWRKAIKAGEVPEAPPPPPRSHRKTILAVGGVAALIMVTMTVAVVVRLRSKTPASTSTQDDTPQRGVDTSPAQSAEGADRLLARLREAIDRDDLDAATKVVELRSDRELLRGRSELAGIRDRILERGRRLLETREPPRKLHPVLTLAGTLNALTSTPAKAAFADELIQRVRELCKKSDERLGDPEAIELIKRMGRARLRPTPPTLLALLDEQVYPMDLSGILPIGPNFLPHFYELMLAAVRLEVEVSSEHMYHLNWHVWRSKPQRAKMGPRETYLRVMLDYHAAGRKGGNPVKRAALVKLESLLHDVSTEELGPSNRARALLQSIRAESEVPNVNPGERVAEALKLAPSDPGVLSYAAERSLMLTQGTPPKTGDRARSLIAQSCDHALAGLRVAEQFEYDTVSTKGPLCFDLRKQSVRALTLAGRDKEARAIVDGLERLTGGRPSQTETLLRLIRDGKSRRKLLFPDGNF